jgi:Ca2+-dependent lipid-binding protein
MIDNTDCPEWGEFHYVPIHNMHENLVLELMDWSSGNKDKSIGSTVFHMNEIITQRKGEDNTVWYDALTKRLNRYVEKNMVEAKRSKMKDSHINDRKVTLYSGDHTERGWLSFAVEFYPTMALADNEEDNEGGDDVSKQDTLMKQQLPMRDLHGLLIRYTPDDLIDLYSYGSGVLTVKIHELKSSQVYECYCQVMIDSLNAQHKTNTLKGRTLAFNETTDAFIKDAGFSRVAIEIKSAETSEKDDERLGYWYESSERLIRQIQRKARQHPTSNMASMIKHAENDEGEWYKVINTSGGEAQIRLSFGYVPLLNYKINPDESLENQGILTVTLLSAKDLKAADKSGTSDPFVKFTVNGDMVHKSAVIKKTCHPVWKNEKFEIPIVSSFCVRIIMCRPLFTQRLSIRFRVLLLALE